MQSWTASRRFRSVGRSGTHQRAPGRSTAVSMLPRVPTPLERTRAGPTRGSWVIRNETTSVRAGSPAIAYCVDRLSPFRGPWCSSAPPRRCRRPPRGRSPRRHAPRLAPAVRGPCRRAITRLPCRSAIRDAMSPIGPSPSTSTVPSFGHVGVRNRLPRRGEYVGEVQESLVRLTLWHLDRHVLRLLDSQYSSFRSRYLAVQLAVSEQRRSHSLVSYLCRLALRLQPLRAHPAVTTADPDRYSRRW